jgi:hypothetical protein
MLIVHSHITCRSSCCCFYCCPVHLKHHSWPIVPLALAYRLGSICDMRLKQVSGKTRPATRLRHSIHTGAQSLHWKLGCPTPLRVTSTSRPTQMSWPEMHWYTQPTLQDAARALLRTRWSTMLVAECPSALKVLYAMHRSSALKPLYC